VQRLEQSFGFEQIPGCEGLALRARIHQLQLSVVPPGVQSSGDANCFQ
jgi:hypothetical protein